MPRHDLKRYQWPPGVSGNPSGRPKRKPLTDVLRKLLDSREVAGELIPGGRTLAEAVMLAIVRAVAAGDVQMIKLIFERLEGKPAADPATEGDHPIATAIQAFLAAEGRTMRRKPAKRKPKSPGVEK